MKIISHLLLVLYAGFLFCRPVFLASEKSEKTFSQLSFSLNQQVAKVYTAPIIQNTGSLEVKNNLPLLFTEVVNNFNFQKAVLISETPEDTYSNTSGYNFIDWPKISINAP